MDNDSKSLTPPRPDGDREDTLLVGLDVGSTTVKFVVVSASRDRILHRDYQRHETKQAEKCLEMLEDIEGRFPQVPTDRFRIFVTGSGGGKIAPLVGARFVQEVNAVSLAVEKLYPDVLSVIELGGQDAKIIVFKIDEESGGRKKIPSMNDKCAGGTGAVIDKINGKLKIPKEDLGKMGYDGIKLHPVAGKCGVFAETDINGLQKQGVPPKELMASLFESIIQQNLSVLTRGHTLRPRVLLLGGPNTYIEGMQQCWRHNLPVVWKERNVVVPDEPLEELIKVPENAQYFAALGAVDFGRTELEDDPDYGRYAGLKQLRWYLTEGRLEEKKEAGSSALVESPEELSGFKEEYRRPDWSPTEFPKGSRVRGFVGLDGGSTSTKAVLLDDDLNVIAKAYQLSKGNPIEDSIEVLERLREQIEEQGCELEVRGLGTTGYAKDTLRDVLGADVALVETVAHTQAGLHFYPDTDVIIDVGGQDIKLIILKNGQVKDFKLNTQCSAGNGYFLQSTAEGFGYQVEEYADIALSAQAMPQFGYGCAVFMQSDIVDFQRQGWAAEEIMAGLCDVLPKNIWLYVSQIPNLAKLGTKFLLQGGTQHNLAAVKAQVDFIRSRFVGTESRPEVRVHRFCGEAGAIGCAVEVHRRFAEKNQASRFIGFDAVRDITYRTTRDESTRCYFCKNKCLRTFIDVQTGHKPEKERGRVDLEAHRFKSGSQDVVAARLQRGEAKNKSSVPLAEGEQRLIIATCEKGTVESVNDMREIRKRLDAKRKQHPDFSEVLTREPFKAAGVGALDSSEKRSWWRDLRPSARRREGARERRGRLRIGIPRVLNLYSMAPWFSAYFESLGLDPRNLIWSEMTSEELFKEGAKRGAIDPCFPSKVCIPHVHHLLYRKHTEARPLDCVFFPMIDSLPTYLQEVQDTRACPTVCATPESVKAAFTKEGDVFAERGVKYLDTFLNFAEPALLERQLFEGFSEILGLAPEENRRACQAAWDHFEAFYSGIRARARTVLDNLEAENGVGVVLLSRPYHHDPGVCHEIPAEFQKQGIPVFTIDSLPRDPDLLERLFGDEVAAGAFASPLSIEDVWKNSYSENTSRKVWAAKYVARHPNLVALELSSFKCGHDAPIYTVVEEIVESSGTPYFCFKDIDENKPTGSIKIRVETIAYFLVRYRERLDRRRRKIEEIENELERYRRQLEDRPVREEEEVVSLSERVEALR